VIPVGWNLVPSLSYGLVLLLDGILVIPVEWNLVPNLGYELVFLLDGILVIPVGWHLVLVWAMTASVLVNGLKKELVLW